MAASTTSLSAPPVKQEGGAEDRQLSLGNGRRQAAMRGSEDEQLTNAEVRVNKGDAYGGQPISAGLGHALDESVSAQARWEVVVRGKQGER